MGQIVVSKSYLIVFQIVVEHIFGDYFFGSLGYGIEETFLYVIVANHHGDFALRSVVVESSYILLLSRLQKLYVPCRYCLKVNYKKHKKRYKS